LAGGNETIRSSPLLVWLSAPGPSTLTAAVSGALLATAFLTRTTVGVWAGLPGVLVCTRHQRAGQAARTWAVFGLVFFGIAFGWMSVVTWPGYAALVAYHTLHVVLFGLVLGYSVRWVPLPLTSVAPPLWVASEFLRSRLFGGLPWMLLAHPLGAKIPFVQFAQWTGAAGVSFMVVMVGAAVAELGLRLRGLASSSEGGGSDPRREASPWVSAVVAGVLVMAACIYGTVRVVRAPLKDGPVVALVQGGVPTPLKSTGSGEEVAEVDRRLWDAYSSLTEELAGDGLAGGGPDLVVWPESSLPGVFGPDVPEDEAGRAGEVRELSRRVGVPMLVGTNMYSNGAQTNSAVLLDGGRFAGRYDKVHLVPFGEYIPLGRIGQAIFPFGPVTEDYAAGAADQEPLRIGRWVVAASICYEDVFGHLARAQVRRGAQVLVNLTNDSWFDGTAEPYQHSMAARFRAIELGVSVVRCTNTGITCIYDPCGRSTGALGPLEAGHLVGTVPLRCRGSDPEASVPTGYLRHGELFAWCCVGASVIVALAAFWRGRGRARRAGPAMSSGR